MKIPEKVCNLFSADLEAGDTSGIEFPVTAMSVAVANAIEPAIKIMVDTEIDAIDVGTGSGVHAAVLACMKTRSVTAIDISKSAIQFAEHRCENLKPSFVELAGESFVDPLFLEMDVKKLSLHQKKYDLIVTNPPAFFGSFSPEEHGDIPVKCGLYDGRSSDALNVQASFLYCFFDQFVRNNLSMGGVVICSWPGLQRRIVADLDKGTSDSTHPIELLEKWFGWRFLVDRNAVTLESFFCHTAPMRDYGLGTSFLKELKCYMEKGNAYSKLVRPGGPESDYLPVYPFGVLALRLENQSPTTFSLVDLK